MGSLKPGQATVLFISVALLATSALSWIHRSVEETRTPEGSAASSAPRTLPAHAGGSTPADNVTGGTAQSPGRAATENPKEPRDGVRLMRAVLESVDPARRGLEAIELLRASEGLPRGAEREHALRLFVVALGHDRELLDQVLALAKDRENPWDLRRIAIIALGRTALEPARSVLWALAESANPQDRLEAVRSLSQGGTDPYGHWTDEALQSLTHVISSSRRTFDARTASGFLRLLENEADAAVASTLAQFLGSVLPEPRLSGARPSEDGYSDLPILPRLMAIAQSHPDPGVRRSALESLQYTRSPQALRFLAEVAEGGSDPDARATALASLRGITLPQDVSRVLERLLQSEGNEQVLRNLVTTVEILDDKGNIRMPVFDRLRTLFERPGDQALRLSILQSWRLAGPACENLLADASVKDPDPEVRKAALRILSDRARAPR